MKKKLMYVAVAAFLLAAYSCNNAQPAQENKEQTTVTETPKAEAPVIKVAELSTDKDYVCGMALTDGGIADTANVDGKVYGFCSKECKEGFVKEPQKYLSQK